LARTAQQQTLIAQPRAWLPRPYQDVARQQFHAGIRRQVLIWHRRAGKDNYALNLAAEESENVVGTYWHLYPMHVQAKRAIWNGIDNQGERFIDQAFPPSRRVSTRANDMQIEFDNGSMWQLCGSDAYDRLVGSNPRGVVFSEWALCDPRAWDYIRPIIRENNGWAVFITTYRGRNHAYRMARRLRNNPNWFVDTRTIDDTTHSDGRRIITAEDIEAERAEGMSEALIQQEYYCNPVAAAEGSIYGKELEKLQAAGRATAIAHDSSKPVLASWSLNHDNEYTVIFWQRVGNESRVIGSKSFPFTALSDAFDYVAQNYPWRYIARHVVPADTPGEAIAFFEDRGFFVANAPETEVLTKATREHLATTWIDTAERPWDIGEENNAILIDALNGYRFAKSTSRDEYTGRPANSWEKHYATAFEAFAAWAGSSAETVTGWHPAPSTALRDRAVI